jgi:hypothetical protein
MAYIQGIQSIRKKSDINDSLSARLAHITLGGQRMGVLSQDEPQPHLYVRTPTSDGLNVN